MSASVTRWAILTGEYPPQPGGVADYTRCVACGLAEAGDTVRVFAPPTKAATESPDMGVTVARLPGCFDPRSLAILDRSLARFRPDRILVQYVPHAFGWKAMNLPFAVWMAARAWRIAPVWVMFHEVAFPFSWRPLKHAALGAITRIMARLLAGAADRVFVSIPAWGDALKRIAPRFPSPEWLPVPCTISGEAKPDAVTAVRSRFAPAGGTLVGHFGTFGTIISTLLTPAVVELLWLSPEASAIMIGRDSSRFVEELLLQHPALTGRIAATGELPTEAVSAHLRACDLLMQPFPDGVSSRRTSVMAALANGVPVVTNLGALSESVWSDTGIATVPVHDPVAVAKRAAVLLTDAAVRAELAARGAALYRENFAREHTIAKLRGTE